MSGMRSVDVAIIGGGPSGLLMASLLAQDGMSVACIDREPPAVQTDARYDGRTMAISYGSQKVFAAAGTWEALAPDACPIRDIHILDGSSPVLLTFEGKEAGAEALGWIIDIRDIRAVLGARAQETGVQHIAPAAVADFSPDADGITVHLQTGELVRARLVIGADGRGSFTRNWFKIPQRSWSYEQQAIVCTVQHEHPHNFVAVENFRPEGPFAILPMTDDAQGRHRSSIVWTEHGSGRHSALDLDTATFTIALQARFPARYGRVALAGDRFCYPLNFSHAASYIAPRMALIADAAHGLHPIAGQGLNMGLRDVAALAELLVAAHKAGGDPGAPELLTRYQRMRRFDTMLMAGATDTLNALFSNGSGVLALARRVGLSAVNRIPAARRFFMKQAMGASGLLPEMIRR